MAAVVLCLPVEKAVVRERCADRRQGASSRKLPLGFSWMLQDTPSCGRSRAAATSSKRLRLDAKLMEYRLLAITTEWLV